VGQADSSVRTANRCSKYRFYLEQKAGEIYKNLDSVPGERLDLVKSLNEVTSRQQAEAETGKSRETLNQRGNIFFNIRRREVFLVARMVAGDYSEEPVIVAFEGWLIDGLAVIFVLLVAFAVLVSPVVGIFDVGHLDPLRNSFPALSQGFYGRLFSGNDVNLVDAIPSSVISLIRQRRIQLAGTDCQIDAKPRQPNRLLEAQVEVTGDLSHVLVFADRFKGGSFTDLALPISASNTPGGSRPANLERDLPLLATAAASTPRFRRVSGRTPTGIAAVILVEPL